MAFTLNGIDASSGVLTLPNKGVWMARVTLATEKPPAAGTKASLVVGSLSLKGTVEGSGSHAGSSEVIILGGAGGWRKNVELPPFRADNGVRLSQVVASLSAKCGETSVLEAGAERTVGYAWTVAIGPGATALDDLTGGAWWVAPDGITHVGTRPLGSRTKAQFSVESYDPADGHLVFSTPNDDIAAFPIGCELAGEGIAPFRVGYLDVRWSDQRVQLDAWKTEPPLRAMINHRTRKKLFSNRYIYRVVEETARAPGEPGGRVNLQIVSKLDPMIDELAVPKLHGSAALDEVLKPSSLVVVEFLGGDPGQPVVSTYFPHTPYSARFDASNSIVIGSSLESDALIQLGGDDVYLQRPIMIAPPTEAYLSRLETWALKVDAFMAAAVGGPMNLPPDVITAIAARVAAFQAGTAFPNGWTSNRTTSQ